MSTAIRTESNGGIVSGVAIGFVVASAVVLALRLYTRIVLLGTTGKDDYTMVVAMVGTKSVFHFHSTHDTNTRKALSIVVSVAQCIGKFGQVTSNHDADIDSG
jgi:ABC-type sugar transport system permease subunit